MNEHSIWWSRFVCGGAQSVGAQYALVMTIFHYNHVWDELLWCHCPTYRAIALWIIYLVSNILYRIFLHAFMKSSCAVLCGCGSGCFFLQYLQNTCKNCLLLWNSQSVIGRRCMHAIAFDSPRGVHTNLCALVRNCNNFHSLLIAHYYRNISTCFTYHNCMISRTPKTQPHCTRR